MKLKWLVWLTPHRQLIIALTDDLIFKFRCNKSISVMIRNTNMHLKYVFLRSASQGKDS